MRRPVVHANAWAGGIHFNGASELWWPTPIFQICARRGLRHHFRISEQNGGDVRVFAFLADHAS
jgi:hypothetical protein